MNNTKKKALFYWELPSWRGLNAGGNFTRQPPFGILRAKDQPSLSLKVRFPRAIISHARSREDREAPYDYRWHNNLTGYNPDRVGHKIKRNSLRRHGVELISWKKYFSKEKADVKFRKELHKNSERSARKEALKLVKELLPEAETSSAGPSAGGNPNAKRKSEQDKGASKAKEKVTQVNSSRSLREYLVDSGAALHIISQQALTKEELRTKRKLKKRGGVSNRKWNDRRHTRSKSVHRRTRLISVGLDLNKFALPNFDGKVMSRKRFHFYADWC